MAPSVGYESDVFNSQLISVLIWSVRWSSETQGHGRNYSRWRPPL